MDHQTLRPCYSNGQNGVYSAHLHFATLPFLCTEMILLAEIHI